MFAIFFTRQYGQVSYPEIANFFTQINPKSVSTLIDRLEQRIKVNHAIRKDFESISRLLEAKVVVGDT